ncbi:MAG: hypothetical protein H0W11_00085 [Gemmatimonadetes bacterium]|nr:hypothetical protein [Gemmatimonadota bacterium]
MSSTGLVTAVSAGVVGILAETDGVGGTSTIMVTAASSPVSPPPGPYSPTTPHWSHIRLEVTDFRIGVQVHGGAAQAEYDWTAAQYDAIMDGNLAEYRKRNPSIKHYPYTLSAWFQAKSGDLYKGTDYLAMKAWYDDPTLNTQGYDIEEAFLHTGLPKTEQNRLVKAGWQGVNDWYANPGDPGYRAYSLYRYNRIVLESYAGQKSDGAFLDSFETHNLGKALGSVEYPTGAAGEAALFGAWETWTKEVRAHISRDGARRRLHTNPAQYWNDWIRKFAIAGGSAHFEMGQSAESAHRYFWDKIADMTAQDVVSQMLSGYSRKHYNDGVLGATFLPGNEKSKAARGKLVELASYYMIRPGASQIDLVRYTLTNFWDRPFSEEWTRAIETDVGHPRESRRVYATGTFSFMTAWGKSWQWRVWAREYDNALVLIHSPWDKDQDRYGDDTAVTVTLPAGTWHMLYEDGTLGSAITSVTLRNAEAAILLKGS